MNGDNLLSIGAFALLSGLSVTALRHYDEVGVLRPASVDPLTGYRRYRPEQVDRARMVCALRGVDLPIEALRDVLDHPDGDRLRTVLAEHRGRLEARARALNDMIDRVDHYTDQGVRMPDLATPRMVQVTITVADPAASIAFYQKAFAATFNEEISSFQFGSWPSDEFFLLTIAHGDSPHGPHPGPDGPARFGLLVDDVDAAHARAVAAGGTELYPPADRPWKPRSSGVADPSGNRIDLYQS